MGGTEYKPWNLFRGRISNYCKNNSTQESAEIDIGGIVMKNFLKNSLGAIASLALILGVASANAPSFMYFYQPKMPKNMKNFTK